MTVKHCYVQDVEFADLANPIAIGDAHSYVTMPYDGEIIGDISGPVVDGIIFHAGSGAGGTSYQIRNVTQARDYFTTRPQFRVADADANNRAPLYGGVLCTHPTFRQGDVLAMDADAVPAGTDSGIAYIWLTCEFKREVD